MNEIANNGLTKGMITRYNLKMMQFRIKNLNIKEGGLKRSSLKGGINIVIIMSPGKLLF
jgi:hypothetical protein